MTDKMRPKPPVKAETREPVQRLEERGDVTCRRSLSPVELKLDKALIDAANGFPSEKAHQGLPKDEFLDRAAIAIFGQCGSVDMALSRAEQLWKARCARWGAK